MSVCHGYDTAVRWLYKSIITSGHSHYTSDILLTVMLTNLHWVDTSITQLFGPVFFQNQGVWLFFLFFFALLCFVEIPDINAKRIDPDQTLLSATSDLGLRFLPITILGFSTKWVKSQLSQTNQIHILTFSTLSKFSRSLTDVFFTQNLIWHFMQIVSYWKK